MSKILFQDAVIGEEGLLKGPFGSDLKKSLYVPRGSETYKVYLQENILMESNFLGNYYISKEYFDLKMKRYAVQENDFIVTCDGTLGEIFQLKNITELGIISSSLLRITINPEIIDYDYFYYYWKAILKNKLTVQANNSVLKHLPGIEVIRKTELCIPNIEEQKKIGKVLKSIDEKIKCNNRVSSQLESLAKTLYDYWFLQFEFPNEEGKPYKSSGGKMVWSEELKKEIPEGWETIRIGDVTEFVKGKIPQYELTTTKSKLNNSPYITIDVANNAIPMFCCSKGMVPVDGETIMVMDGAASGDVYIGNKGTLGSTFSKISSIRNDISDSFLYMLLKNNSVIYKKANTGSTVPHANTNFIKAMKIALPKDCSKFSKKFDGIMRTIENNRSQNQQLSSLRDWLLPMLMNGQVTFKDEN